LNRLKLIILFYCFALIFIPTLFAGMEMMVEGFCWV
jgi:hypothetical protein